MKIKEQEVTFKVTKIIDYPSFRQSNEYSCGVSSVQSAIIYCKGNKYDVPETSYYQDLSTTEKDGTPVQKIISFLKKKGVKIESGVLSQDELKECINNNIPVIICIQAWGDNKNYKNNYDNGHYVTVIGYNNDGFLFEDPSISSKIGFIKYKELDNRWHDIDKDGNKYEHYGIKILCKQKYSPDKMEIIEGCTMNLIESYLNFLYQDNRSQAKEWRGPNIPYGDDSHRPNLIRQCFQLESAKMKINCLRKLRDQVAMNPIYQTRIDRFVDAISGIYEPTREPGTHPGSEFKCGCVGEDL